MGFYRHDGPVVGPAYVGREILLRNLRDGALRGRSVALCGGPKTGRTGALLTVQAAVRERWRRQPKETIVAPVYADLGECRRESAAQFAERLWRIVAEALQEAAVGAGGAPPAVPAPSFARTREPLAVFAEACADWAARARGTAAWTRQVWLLDNADALLDGKHDDVVRFLRQAAGRAVDGGPEAVLLAGGRALRDALVEKGHPLASLRPLTLGAMSPSDTARLVRAGLPDLSASTLEELMLATGRHPYALQAVLARLEAQGDVDDLAQAVGDARPQLNALFAAIWNEIDLGRGLTYRGAYAAPEHALMQLLVDSGAPLRVKSAEAQLGMQSLREFADVLEYLGVVERSLLGDTPTVRAHFRLWNEWYGERIRW